MMSKKMIAFLLALALLMGIPSEAGPSSNRGINTTVIKNGSGSLIIPNSGTVTAPTGTYTIVGKDTTDTLTNKTIAAGSNTISGLTNSNLSGSAGITNANQATMAAHSYKGNNTGSTAVPSDLTQAQLTAEINVMVGDSGSGGTKGLCPAPGAGDAAAGKYCGAGGTWSVPAGTAAVAPIPTEITSSSAVVFTVTAANATINAIYADPNGAAFTVTSTITGGTSLSTTAGVATSYAQTSGTLTKSSGTGDATITYSVATYPTYTTPANCLFLRVRMSGGGEGGEGSGTSGGSTGGYGGETMFGGSYATPLLDAAGGGISGQATPGTASLGTGPKGLALTGGPGWLPSSSASVANLNGGGGGASPVFGGASNSFSVANSGSGGRGGGANGGTALFNGRGGGSGGFIDAIITSPSASYSYLVAPGGPGGAAGTSGSPGLAGAAGRIEVTAYFQ